MRYGLMLLTVLACGTGAGAASAQGYYDTENDRGPSPRYDRAPPPRDLDRRDLDRRDLDRDDRRDFGRDDRRDFGRDDRRDSDRPRPRFVCLLDPSPPYPGRRCETHPGRPGSPCRCNGPYVGHREIDRRD